MRARGLIGADGWLTAEGRAARQRIEALTDDLAAPAYDGLEPGELDQLIAGLEPLAAALTAGLSWPDERVTTTGAGLTLMPGVCCVRTRSAQ